MVPANTLIKKLLSVNNCIIDGFDFETDIDGVTTFRVYLHPLKRHSNCCHVCGKRVLSMTRVEYTVNGEP